MEAISSNSTQFATRKSQLKERIKAMENERNSLEREILALREKVDIMELERYSSSLDNEIGTLKIEKAILEEKIANSSAFHPPQEVGSVSDGSDQHDSSTPLSASDVTPTSSSS